MKSLSSRLDYRFVATTRGRGTANDWPIRADRQAPPGPTTRGLGADRDACPPTWTDNQAVAAAGLRE